MLVRGLGGCALAAAMFLLPRIGVATEPPSCGTEDVYIDLSGFYAVEGGCGDRWCAEVVELQRWDTAYCAFNIVDADDACTFVTVTEDGQVLNPVAAINECSGLLCASPGERLDGGGLRFSDCAWDSNTFQGDEPTVPCDPLVLTPIEGPLPADNHPCRAQVGDTGEDADTGGTTAASTSSGGGGPTTTGSSSGDGGGAGTGGEGDDDGCSIAGRRPTGGVGLAGALLLLVFGRRRR